MGFRHYFRGSVAIGALFAASAAQADLTAEAVWESWRSYYEAFDQVVTFGAETRTANGLVISDVVISTELPDGDGDIRLDVGDVTLSEQGDGTVLIQMAETMPMRFTFSEMSPGDAFVLTLSQPGLRTVASAIDEGVRYEYAGPEFSIRLTELIADGEAIDANLDLSLGKYSGFYELSDEEEGRIDSDFIGASLALVANFTNPDDPSSFLNLNFSMDNLRIAFAGVGLADFDPEELPEALAEGLTIDLRTSYQALRFAAEFRERFDHFVGSGSVGSGASEFLLSPERLTYSTTSRDTSVNVAGSEIPFPSVDVSYGELTIGASAPLAPADGGADVSTVLRLVDLTLSDDIWAMADPMGAFPRGPITAVLDLSGTVDLAGPLYDDDMMFMMMMAGPLALGEISEIRLNELRLSAVGAELTGSGQATLDFDDFETFGGFPKPVGSVTFGLMGGNALLDKLVQMGLVPQGEAQGMRMMLGLFTRQVDGNPDHLTTTLEAREDGSIFANGQQIQ